MPDLFDCHLIVEGTSGWLKRFKKLAKCQNSEISMNSFIPKPDGNDNIDWNIKNWGIKSDISMTSIRAIGKNYIVYSFISEEAPTKAIEIIGKLFPKMSFELNYKDTSTGKQRCLIVENGVKVLDER